MESFISGEPGFELGEGFGHVAATVAKADMPGLVVDGAREEKDTGLAHEAFAEGLHVLSGLEAGETDSAGVGRSPFEEVGVTRKEGGELRKVAKNNLEIAINEFLAVAEDDGSEEFAGGASADGGVVLERDDPLKDGSVAAGEPAEAKSGEAISFADGAEAEGAFIDIARSGEAGGRVVLEFAINLVGEDIDAVASGKFQDAAENFRRHEQARGIVG